MYILYFFRQRFKDICDNKVSDSAVFTVMKDISYTKKNSNERVINKIQDFVYDDVLFDYCQLPQVCYLFPYKIISWQYLDGFPLY